MTFQERYQYNPATDLLGKGGFARVYKAKDLLLDREVAIKVFNATDKGQYTVIEEIKKAIRLQHPNLLRYYDVAIVENTNPLGEQETIQIGVMELANAGDLKQFARNNPGSPVLFNLLQQVLGGLEYLHQKGIIHRDLKPQNILLAEEDGVLTAKISDFGISKNLDSNTNSASMAIGTIEYMAPEQFSPGKYGINGKIGTNVDLWSFGIMVHELLTNEPLFGQRSGNTTAEQIMNAILSQELPQDIDSLPEPFRTVIKKCLVNDAKKRVQRASEIIHMFSQEAGGYSPVSSGPETMAIDKSMLPADEAVSMVIPRKNLGIVNDDGKEKKSNKAQTGKKITPIIWAAAIILLLGCSITYFVFFNNTKGNSASDLNWEEVNLLLQNKKYTEVIAKLRTRVSDPAAQADTAFYSRMIPLYAKALLGSGDTSMAVPYLEKGVQLGNSDCIFEVGSVYYNGKFRAKDYKKAFEYFEKGAALNDPKAEVMLGNMYFMGLGVPENYGEAIRYYFSAADHGNSVAMYALGLAFLNGSGVTEDPLEARKWFQKVIDKNDNPAAVTAAQTQLAGM
jgi:serine/threonine protein kinase